MYAIGLYSFLELIKFIFITVIVYECDYDKFCPCNLIKKLCKESVKANFLRKSSYKDIKKLLENGLNCHLEHIYAHIWS